MKIFKTFAVLAFVLGSLTTLTFGQSPEANPTCADFGYNRSVKIENVPFTGNTTVMGFGSIYTEFPDTKTLNWSTFQSPVAFIKAVIVKGGPDATVKHYNPSIWVDNGIRPPANSSGTIPDISHVEFCYHLVPTAAPVNLQGRVLDRYGKGISFARVAAIDLETGIGKYAYTNSFGYYNITDLKIGAYAVGVTAKRYTFETQYHSLTSDLTGIVFRAN